MHRYLCLIVLLSICLPCTGIVAQQFMFKVDDADNIPPHVHAERRARLLDSLPPHAVAIIFSADVRNRQNDVDYEYRQSSDLLYLTGYPFPHAALLLTKDHVTVKGIQTHLVFFARERNPNREQWQGVTAGPNEAEQHYGLDVALPLGDLPSVLDQLFDAPVPAPGKRSEAPSTDPALELHKEAAFRKLYFSGWSTKAVPMPALGSNLYVDAEIKKGLRSKYGELTIESTIPALVAMREVKDTAELRLMRKAVDITVRGHLAAMKAARTSSHEFEIEAVMEYEFKRLGAEDVGYPSIVGTNYNSCILHYTTNRRNYSTGDLVLADCGAEYHGYTADVTRTYPVSGTFSTEQRIIYNIVLEAQDSGIAACRAGAPFKAPHEAATRVIARRLVELGIIESETDVREYFMHGTSHYLGLDVHDCGTRGPLKPNTVITVEPGIYIAEGSRCDRKWWNIGVRIEDDILVTNGTPENLSAHLPRTIADIEAVMR